MNCTILAIESSCDDTSAAIVKNGKVLNNIVATQSVHQKYGGVVPELASRAHQKNIVPVVDNALSEAGVRREDLSAIAFTRGPGLLGSLLVGASFAKGMALSLNIPLIGVNHMQAHILAHFIDEPVPSFPFLCLTVSGGHTQLVRVDDYLSMEVIGNTLDDAIGEAFDKTAKLLGLPYPGGPLVDKYASEGNPDAYSFPMSEMDGYDYSFSGIKTAIRYFLRDNLKDNPSFIEDHLHDVCASVQKHFIDMVLVKLEKAALDFGINRLAIAGGVSANSALRKAMTDRESSLGWEVFIPALEYCTDNAGMIAMNAYFKFQKGEFADLSTAPEARLPFA